MVAAYFSNLTAVFPSHPFSGGTAVSFNFSMRIPSKFLGPLPVGSGPAAVVLMLAVSRNIREIVGRIETKLTIVEAGEVYRGDLKV